MRGICIDAGSTMALIKDQEYFLFEHGPNNYLVSKFNNRMAHCGSYRREHFKLIQDEPFEHPRELLGDGRVIYFNENPDNEPYIEQPKQTIKRFVARVSKRRNGFRIDDLYIISEKGPNGYYNVYLKDRPAGSAIGSYVTNFFEVIMPYDDIEKPEAIKRPERPKLEPQEPPAVIPLPEAASVKNEPEQKPKRQKKTKNNIPDGQMDIFDFLEV